MFVKLWYKLICDNRLLKCKKSFDVPFSYYTQLPAHLVVQAIVHFDCNRYGDIQSFLC